MKHTIQYLLEKSEKHIKSRIENKLHLSKFDENFGKEKLHLIDGALGEDRNKQVIVNKMNK